MISAISSITQLGAFLLGTLFKDAKQISIFVFNALSAPHFSHFYRKVCIALNQYRCQIWAILTILSGLPAADMCRYRPAAHLKAVAAPKLPPKQLKGIVVPHIPRCLAEKTKGMSAT